MSTNLDPKVVALAKVLLVGNQKFGEHRLSFNPQLVPLKTTLTSSVPFGTVK